MVHTVQPHMGIVLDERVHVVFFFGFDLLWDRGIQCGEHILKLERLYGAVIPSSH